jgi:serine/threonine protein phosphatase PrpC
LTLRVLVEPCNGENKYMNSAKTQADATDQTPNTGSCEELAVVMAQKTVPGIKTVNEDAVATAQAPNKHALVNKGVCALIADGVSSAEAGREASEFCVANFIEEYYRTPDTWSVSQSGEKTLSSINLNLFKKSHAFTQQEKGFLCTFSGLILKSRTAHFFHAGDSHIYLLRDGQTKLLTRDHTVNIGGGKNILARAVGMDSSLQIDYGKQPLKDDDLFLLSTDGVHDFISPAELSSILQTKHSEQQKCDALVELALSKGSDDNLSCALVRVKSLPQESRDDFNSKLTRLPFPPDLEPGMSLDGYRIEKELFASSRSQVYLVRDLETGEEMVMKTPSLSFQDDISYIDRFIQEEWIGKRIDSDYVVKIITQTRQRNFLYYLLEYVPGLSLDKWMLEKPLPSPKMAISIVKQIAQALQAFHKMETIHQDLKPGNILIDKNSRVKVIDFGSVFVAGIAEIFVPLEHEGALGTASYSDPHYLQGKNTGVQGDIYALATISYELFTGQLPYGEKIEQCQNSFDFAKLRYRPAHEINPRIPLWFDRALEKGVSFDLSVRYSRLQELIDDVSKPNPVFLQDDPKVANSRGLLFWQLMSGFWILMLVIVVILFSAS